ncbi:MAG: Protease 3 precursor [Verrucomicrobiota bacterium]|jgi:insulysin
MKRLVLLLALVLPLLPVTRAAEAAAAAIPPREQAPNDRSEYRRLVLSNGLKVILLSDPALNKSAASVSVGAGSLQDPANRQGLAHFLEHMLFLGTEKYPDEAEYSKFLTSNGGYSNAYTQQDHTNYHFEIRHEAFEGALERFSQFFIAPLFDARFTEREMNAVNSEFQKNSENDAWRLSQLETTFYRDGHPLKNFAIGNRSTLAGTTREELLAFYRAHYSANLMSVALTGNASLDQLEQWARKYFSAVENRNLPEPRWPADYLPTKAALRLIRSEPVPDARSLSLSFPLPATRAYALAKPSELLGFILGYEGAGSLLSTLKAEGLATGLSAGGGEYAADFGEFNVKVALTPAGFANYSRVLALVFATINDLKRAGLPRGLFEERRTMAQLDELFTDKGEGTGRATELANLAREYPLELAERIPYLWTDESPAGYQLILNQLRPDNLLVQLVAKGQPADRTEPHYGAKYSYTEDTGPAYAALLNPPAAPSIHLPAPNPFVPKEVAQVPVQPVRLINEPGLSLYHLQDDHFQRPHVAEIFRFRLPRTLGTLENSVLLQFYSACVSEALNETNYTASTAGLAFSLNASIEGVYLSIDGYNESAATLLDQATGSLIDFKISEERFAALKDAIVRGLANFPKGEAWQVLLESRRAAMREFYFRPQEQLPVAQKLTLADIRAFAKKLYARGRIEALIHGNISATDAIASARKVAATLKSKPIADNEVLRRRLLVQPAKESLLASEKFEVNNSAFRQEFVIPGNSAETRAATLILSNFIGEPFYSELRTHQQLGYIVQASAGEDENTFFSYFIVQSGEHPADELQTKAEAFIKQLPDLFGKVTDKDWEDLVAGALAALQEEDKTIAERAGRLFKLAYDYNGDWSRREDTIVALEKLDRARVLAILKDTLDPAKLRERTFLGFAKQHTATTPPKTSFTDTYTWKKTRKYE